MKTIEITNNIFDIISPINKILNDTIIIKKDFIDFMVTYNFTDLNNFVMCFSLGIDTIKDNELYQDPIILTDSPINLIHLAFSNDCKYTPKEYEKIEYIIDTEMFTHEIINILNQFVLQDKDRFILLTIEKRKQNKTSNAVINFAIKNCSGGIYPFATIPITHKYFRSL